MVWTYNLSSRSGKSDDGIHVIRGIVLEISSFSRRRQECLVHLLNDFVMSWNAFVACSALTLCSLKACSIWDEKSKKQTKRNILYVMEHEPIPHSNFLCCSVRFIAGATKRVRCILRRNRYTQAHEASASIYDGDAFERLDRLQLNRDAHQIRAA